MAMMQIRQVRMAVFQRAVLVPVPVLLRTLICRMLVLVMLVVDVHVLVLHRLVHVPVLMVFGEHEPCRQGS